MIDLQHANTEFQSYLNAYDQNDPKVKLKIIHTSGVVKCAEEISSRMGLSEEDKSLAKLIALLHDIGRFEQLRRFDSFEPNTMDHAAYGADLLFGSGKLIRRFIKEDTWDDIIRVSIARHSDFKLDKISDSRTLLHARLIRDADKLDNCRVKLEDSMELLLGVTEAEAGREAISDKIWETCMKKQAVLSSDRKSRMDYWVSYVAYFFDINFPETFSIIQERDYAARIIHRIPYKNPDTRIKMKTLCRMMQEYIAHRIDFITTYKRVHVTPLEPRKEDILIEDIAHALSLMVRANGHFPEFYSVGQHCVHCAEEAMARQLGDRIALACLLHDAGEAYLADITRPVKRNLDKYREIEERLLDAVYEKFLETPLTEEEKRQVKCIDDALLCHEFFHYMGEWLFEEIPVLKSSPVFQTEAFHRTEKHYLELFHDLRK